MRYFIDYEFNENVHPIEPISLGVVAEDGREFYAVFEGYEMGQKFAEEPKTRDDYPRLWSCNDWVIKHVFPILWLEEIGITDIPTRIGTEKFIKEELVALVGLDPVPEFWGYYADYDWFLLTRMFKGFDKMPSKWPQICYDLHQYARHMGMHRLLPKKLEPAHNSLIDARWTKLAFERVKESRDMPYNKAGTWP